MSSAALTMKPEIPPTPESETAVVTEIAPRSRPGPKPGSPLAAKSRRGTNDAQRFFLPKEPAGDGVELGEEVETENEALVRAFRSEQGVFYRIEAYRAEIETQEDKLVLVKKPAR